MIPTATDLALKAATRRATLAAGRPDAVAALFDRAHQTVQRWGDPTHPEFIPLRYVPVLEVAGL